MADVRPSFVTLEDVSTGAGLPLHKALQGDTSVGKNSHPALVATDSGDLLRYLKVNANRELVVSLESADLACLTAEGGVVGSQSFQDLATITLANSAVYKQLAFMGSCFRDAVYEVVWVDDVGGTDTETILATFRTDAGNTTHSDEFECAEFTSGGTGVQELRIRGKQLQNVPSDIDGMIAVKEVQ
jgi:hypothetical protein